MPIYIDVTSFLKVNFITGIQRVVWEILIRILYMNDNIILLNYIEELNEYEKISNSNFINFYKYKTGKKADIMTGDIVYIENIKKGSVFFEIDSVWNNKLKRSYLYPRLKDAGVIIVVHIYDIIPVLFPKYCHQDTVFRFLDYIGATLQHADSIITNTNSTKEDLNKLLNSVMLPEIEINVINLGSDFQQKTYEIGNVDSKAIEIVSKGKYILQVGTIEPRKNHKIVLDAFDKKLKDLGINVVFVGRIGWNVKDIETRINNHKLLNRQLFYLSNCNDETVDYLYKNAFLSIFPTYYEGFGLPIIESIERNIPVISSECKVLKEVGKEYCDYFDPDNYESIVELVEKYLDENEYIKKKNKLKEYKHFTWNESAELISDNLKKKSGNIKFNPKKPKQIFIITAQENLFLDSIVFIEKFMEFISEVVVACPKNISDFIYNNYNGKLKLRIITDDEILDGIELPKDHAKRNFLLRCKAIEMDSLDDVFIMADDDYRPLVKVDVDYFVEYGKYKSFYYNDFDEWSMNYLIPTSFDNSMELTKIFLQQNGLNKRMYASHMPQIIDKRIYKEILKNYKGIEFLGLDEWSVYFNYSTSNYPEIFQDEIFSTMCWPAKITDWNLKYIPNYFVFENFYSNSYKTEETFGVFSKVYHDNTLSENIKKVQIMNKLVYEAETIDVEFNLCNNLCRAEENKNTLITVNAEDSDIVFPEILFMSRSSNLKIEFIFNGFNIEDIFNYSFEFIDNYGISTLKDAIEQIPINSRKNIKLNFYVPEKTGDYVFNIDFKFNSGSNISGNCNVRVY